MTWSYGILSYIQRIGRRESIVELVSKDPEPIAQVIAKDLKECIQTIYHTPSITELSASYNTAHRGIIIFAIKDTSLTQYPPNQMTYDKLISASEKDVAYLEYRDPVNGNLRFPTADTEVFRVIINKKIYKLAELSFKMFHKNLAEKTSDLIEIYSDYDLNLGCMPTRTQVICEIRKHICQEILNKAKSKDLVITNY